MKKYVDFKGKKFVVKVDHYDLYTRIQVACGKPKFYSMTTCEKKNTKAKVIDLMKRAG